MEISTTNTRTNIVDEHIKKIVRLCVEGDSIKEAIKEVRNIEKLKSKLDKLIIKNNFNLVAPEVVKASQKLDKAVVKEQIKRAAMQSNLRKTI